MTPSEETREAIKEIIELAYRQNPDDNDSISFSNFWADQAIRKLRSQEVAFDEDEGAKRIDLLERRNMHLQDDVIALFYCLKENRKLLDGQIAHYEKMVEKYVDRRKT